MANADRRWMLGRTALAWDEADKAKVRHMLGRGKSIEFIHSYIGMPIELIESIQRRMTLDGLDRDTGSHDRVIDNWLTRQPAIPPDYRGMHREDLALTATNNAFVKRIREVGLVPA